MTWAAIPKRILFCFLLMLATVASGAETDDKPIIVVKNTISRILKVLSDESISEADAREKVAAIAGERIDYQEMSQRVLGINWSKADASQQQRFVHLFREIVLHRNWARMKQFNNEDVIYFTSTIDKDIFAAVDTVIQSETVEIPVTYNLRLTNGRWLAYDFIIEDQSLISNYRNSFASVIKNHGVDRLLEEMEKTVNEEST